MIKQRIKAKFLVICGLVCSCFPAAKSEISNLNEVKIVEEHPGLLKRTNSTVAASYTDRLDIMLSLWNSSNHLNFSYCQTMPEFKLGSGSLITYMMRLKLCYLAANRPWFDQACQERTYGFTDYHRAVYIKFCTPQKFQMHCGFSSRDETSSHILRQWMRRHSIMEVSDRFSGMNGNGDAIESNVSDLLVNRFHCDLIQSFFGTLVIKEKLITNQANPEVNLTKDLEEPFYDIPFTEWFLTYRVFCEPVACGTSHKDYQNNSLSAYDCFPSACKRAIIFTMVFDSILAVIIVVANILVLTVAFRTSVMKSIPGYFKISLAISDLMVGLFVLPGSVYHHYVLSIAPLPYRKEGQSPHVTDYFNQPYLSFMGIFTVLSFSVSIYTMGAASVDRYLAITKPFKYRKGDYLTKKRCVFLFVLIWFFGFAIAIYPVFTNTYNISALGLILSTGGVAVIIYAVTLGLPLLAVWVINGAMLKKVYSEKKIRRSLSNVSHANSVAKVSKRFSKNKEKTKQGSSESKLEETLNRLPSSSDLSVEDDVFEANDNFKNMSNNCGKKTYHKTHVQTTHSAQSRFTNIGSSVHSQFKRKLTHSTSSSSSANVEKRLTKTLGVMITAFTVAILPCILVLGVQPTLTMQINPRAYPKSYSASTTNAYTTAEYFASRLFLSNSFWNCIIYSIRNRLFRRALEDVFICDEDKRRRLRHASMTGTTSRGPRSRPHSKAHNSTDNGRVAYSVTDNCS